MPTTVASRNQRQLAHGTGRNPGLWYFPGFEVATSEKVHWVCLFPEETTYRQLEDYLVHLGKLHRDDAEERARPVDLTGQQLLSRVAELQGFCYGAHVTLNNGLLKGKDSTTSGMTLGCEQPRSLERSTIFLGNISLSSLNQNPDYKRDRPVAVDQRQGCGEARRSA